MEQKDAIFDLLKILLTPDGRGFYKKFDAMSALKEYSKEEIALALEKAMKERKEKGRF